MEIVESIFGNDKDGNRILQYVVSNNMLKFKVINYGAILVELHTPDRNGNLGDVILGFDSPLEYINDDTYQGATIGRYANRIANGIFELDGKKYNLNQNDGSNHLHGGIHGFNDVLWEAEEIKKNGSIGIRFTYRSADGEENYPGNLISSVTYLLVKNKLKINFQATTDKKTPLNMTHHSYFNLHGPQNGNILDHIIKIYADQYLPVNDKLVPTGEVKPVANTPMDFTTATRIGDTIEKTNAGYDHNWILKGENTEELKLAAEVLDSYSGRKMKLYTTKPGLQFYSGNFLDNIKGKSGSIYNKHYGLCLEPQFFPDSPNHSEFPFSFLAPGEKYNHRIEYEFSAK